MKNGEFISMFFSRFFSSFNLYSQHFRCPFEIAGVSFHSYLVVVAGVCVFFVALQMAMSSYNVVKTALFRWNKLIQMNVGASKNAVCGGLSEQYGRSVIERNHSCYIEMHVLTNVSWLQTNGAPHHLIHVRLGIVVGEVFFCVLAHSLSHSLTHTYIYTEQAIKTIHFNMTDHKICSRASSTTFHSPQTIRPDSMGNFFSLEPQRKER